MNKKQTAVELIKRNIFLPEFVYQEAKQREKEIFDLIFKEAYNAGIMTAEGFGALAYKSVEEIFHDAEIV